MVLVSRNHAGFYCDVDYTWRESVSFIDEIPGTEDWKVGYSSHVSDVSFHFVLEKE